MPESTTDAAETDSYAAHQPFEDIYAIGGWAGVGSGPGSLPHNAQPYVDFVVELLRERDIATVVDVGCGDWQMWPPDAFQHVQRHKGFDIVPSVIHDNQRRAQSSQCEFYVADATRDPLPAADLLLCKEVLQHLPNSDVLRFLANACQVYPLIVVCDDIWIGPSSRWRRGARQVLNRFVSPPVRANQDIEPGGYRPLDYSAALFDGLALTRPWSTRHSPVRGARRSRQSGQMSSKAVPPSRSRGIRSFAIAPRRGIASSLQGLSRLSQRRGAARLALG